MTTVPMPLPLEKLPTCHFQPSWLPMMACHFNAPMVQTFGMIIHQLLPVMPLSVYVEANMIPNLVFGMAVYVRLLQILTAMTTGAGYNQK